MSSAIAPRIRDHGVDLAGRRVPWRRLASLGLAALFTLASTVRGQCHSWDPVFGQFGPFDNAAALLTVQDGTGESVIAGGYFEPNHVAKWNGTSWSIVGTLGIYNDSVLALEMYDSGTGPQLYAGGLLHPSSPPVSPSFGLARWDGTSWSAPGGGLAGTVEALVVYQRAGASVLVAGGLFGYYGTGFNHVNRIAAWNGTSWSPLGSNTLGGGFPDGEVLALTVWDSGQGPELYAGGSFTTADGTPAIGIARWNGTSWSDVGTHPPFGVRVFAIFDDGSGPALYAASGGTSSPLWRFDGATWTAINLSLSGQIYTMTVFDDGDGPALFLGGVFTQVGGINSQGLARFNGVHCTPVGGGTSIHGPWSMSSVEALAAYSNGVHSQLAISGWFDTVGALTVRYFAAWRGCTSPIDTLCFGDGTLRACPCGNQGALGHGCAWHNNPAGAELAASGSPASDTIVLTASGMPLSAPSTVFLKGDQLLDAPVTFGDGLRCVSGTLIRLGTKTNVNGAAQYPTAGNASVSTRGGTPPGSGMIGYYQTWYRNAAVFCAPETYNVTNGVRIVW